MDTVRAVAPLDRVPDPADPRGAAAEAIRGAEAALALQNSIAATVDLQVVTAVLNAHTSHAGGAAALDVLQHEIEAAVMTRTDLDTPAGAREFQRYLIDKLHDIRAVVDDTALDDTSKAALAAALASLYTSAASADPAPSAQPTQPGATPGRAADAVRQDPPPGPPVDLALGGGLGDSLGDSLDGPGGFDGFDGGLVDPAPPGPAVMPAGPPGAAPPAPGFGGLPALSGLSAPPLPIADLLGMHRPESIPPDLVTESATDTAPEPAPEPASEPAADAADNADNDPASAAPGETPTGIPTATVDSVIAAAVAGTPIPDAFAAQGITIPPPGTPVTPALDPARLRAGDIGILADRHALALGNGKALMDNQIQPIETVNRPGFLGWQHPPAPAEGGPADHPRPPEPPPATVPAD